LADAYGRRSLAAGAMAAFGASVCCVGPLILLGLGISGAWIGTLTELEPARPYFIAATVAFLGLALRKLYLVPPTCSAGSTCADPRILGRQRLTFWIVGLSTLGLLAVPEIAPVFMY
jgi:mercuric ion transport protein